MAFELDGIVSKAGNGVYNVSYERRYTLAIEAVWAALTEPKRLADWLAEAKLGLRLGGTIELYWPTPDERMTGKIVEFDPPRLLAFTWPEPDGAPNSIVRWELTEVKGGCRLLLTNTLLRKEYLLSVATGWHAHLDELLGAATRTSPLSWTTERVQAFYSRQRGTLSDRYRANIESETT